MKGVAVLLIALIAACAIMLIIITGAYPLVFMRASANIGRATDIIWAREANRVAEATLTYYQTTLGTATTTIAITPALKTEARQKAVDALIEQALIANILEQMHARADAETLLQKKFAAYAARPEFAAAVSLAYGLNNAEFIALIARPETEKETLKQKKRWDDAALAAWLAEEKQKTQIARFFK